jgi:hypothetical protein
MIYLLIALAIIIGAIWAFVVFPTFRIVVGILVLIGGGLVFVANQNAKNAKEEQIKSEIKREQERVACEAKKEAEKKASEEADKKKWTIVRPSQVELRDTLLTPPAYRDEYSVTASVKNRSAVNISKIKMNVVAFDCPAETANFSQCDVVGHQEREFYSNVPAGEVRQIKGAVILRDVPKPRGKFSWSFRVLGVKASSESETDEEIYDYLKVGCG